ncbi:MAG: leucine-rich repeat protein, partial [Clostridia bacterium]|nr:leucine-rich repeat protein [Clostridia bacterium]
IGNGVEYIGLNAFNGCSSVKTLVVGNSLSSFENLPITSALESITIGDSITEIGTKKFYEFTNLKSVTIGSGVTSIDYSAFNSCSALTSVTFAEDSQLTAIGDSAFFGCTGLTSVIIPDSVTTIGYDAFSACSALTSVTFAEDSQLTAIGKTAFHSTGLTEITIPAYTLEAEDEELQAEIITRLYKVWFSHKNMESIIYWNLVDGYAAFAPQGSEGGENYYHGGLLRYDFTKKPAYNALYNLINKEWHTSIDTECSGIYTFKGFYGDYELETEADGKTVKVSFELTPDADNQVIIEI